MESQSEQGVEDPLSSDPSWILASELSQKYFSLPTHVEHLFRSGWMGDLTVAEYVRILGFTRLEPIALLKAAELPGESRKREAVEQAISVLGARFSAVVLAVNYFARTLEEQISSPLLNFWLQFLIDNVEIGYRIGGKTFAIGIEGGSLCGMSQATGQLILLAENPKAFTQYHKRLVANEKISKQELLDFFGCEPYQIASCVIQRFGFGRDLALGIALSHANRSTTGDVENDPGIIRWKACSQWIASLVSGMNYPADPEMRRFFEELTPPVKGDRNMNLEVLYTEVTKVRQKHSEWEWHLSRSTRSTPTE